VMATNGRAGGGRIAAMVLLDDQDEAGWYAGILLSRIVPDGRERPR